MSDSGKAVFLSYASQDADAAKRICDALRQAGVEVWFDQSELVGGDAWDQKIRKQIRECALLIPIISASTNARAEGYFRLEWRLADQRTHLMGRSKAFLLPVTIDGTTDADADVPDSFVAVQWTKAPGGEVPVGFAARVKRLLDGDVGRGLRTPPTPEKAGFGDPALQKKSPRWLAPVIAGGVIALLALVFTRPWENKSSPELSARPNAPTAAKSAAPWSEARKLAERARALTFEHNARRSDFDSASLLLEQAAKLDPNDATVWAVSAMLDARYIDEGYDNSDARRAAATHHADRAIALDATGRDARFARAFALIRASNYSPEAEKEGAVVFRALIAEDPGDAEALTCLGFAHQAMGELDEALRLFDRLAGMPGEAGHAAFCQTLTYWNARRYREALEKVTQAVRLDPTVPALLIKIQLEMVWLGDLDRARESLAALPASALLEDSSATLAWWLHYWHREYDGALGDLLRVPREVVASRLGVVARSTLEAITLRAANRRDGAELKARLALESVERRLVNEPTRRELTYEKIILLGMLGRREEARTQLKVFRELLTTQWSPDPDLYLQIGDNEAALGEFAAIIANPQGWTAGALKLEPLYDPLRSDPRFQALLAQAERDPRMSPTAEQKTENGRRTADTGGRTAASTPSLSLSLPPDAKSVAVLAFANLSDDKGNEYFSDGISEELLNQLGKVPGLKVAGRTSAFSFKGLNVPEAEIAGKLGVAYVVTGSVQKSGAQVRITARLVKAADGFQVWSEKFTRDLKDIFAVQDEIAGLIAQQLQLKLAASERAKRVVNPEAYRLVLEGRQFWNLRTEEGFTKAEAAFSRAIALDPEFAEAHSGLAGVYIIRGVYRELDGLPITTDDLRQAEREARRALDLDANSAEGHAVFGYVHLLSNRLAESEPHFQRAVADNPNSALVRSWYALLLAAQGRLEDSFREYQTAAELDPLWFINVQLHGATTAYIGRFGEALEINGRSAALRTDTFIPNLGQRARILLELGRKQEACALARTILAQPDKRPRWTADVQAILALWEGGRREEAEGEAAKLFARWAPDNYLRGFTLVAMGRFDEALPYLQYTPSPMIRDIYWERMWDPWRDDPRFTQLLQRFNRTEEYKVARATLAKMQRERGK